MLPLLALQLAVGVSVSQNVGDGNRNWYAQATAARARRLNQTPKPFFLAPAAAENVTQKVAPRPSLVCTIIARKADPPGDDVMPRKAEPEIDPKIMRRSDCR